MRRLTTRGRSFLAAGVAAVLGGVQIGEQDFVRLGLFALLLPALTVLVLRSRSPRTWLRRSLAARQVEEGGTTEVVLEVGNAGRRRSGRTSQAPRAA